MPVHAQLDHLVVAARRLDEGRAWLEHQLGVPLSPGGEHARFGTHNALLNLGGGAYLEVIAVNPAAPAPERPRWFGLDDPAMQASLAAGPRLIHWVARVPDLPAALTASPEDHGEVLDMVRGDLRWQLSVPEDGHLPLGGVLPSLIAWGGAHPTERLPASGVHFAHLGLSHPEPGRVHAALERLGLSGVAVQAGAPGLRADLLTPTKPVRLG